MLHQSNGHGDRRKMHATSIEQDDRVLHIGAIVWLENTSNTENCGKRFGRRNIAIILLFGYFNLHNIVRIWVFAPAGIRHLRRSLLHSRPGFGHCFSAPFLLQTPFFLLLDFVSFPRHFGSHFFRLRPHLHRRSCLRPQRSLWYFLPRPSDLWQLCHCQRLPALCFYVPSANCWRSCSHLYHPHSSLRSSCPH